MSDSTNRKLIRDGEAKQAQPMRPLGDYVVTKTVPSSSELDHFFMSHRDYLPNRGYPIK